MPPGKLTDNHEPQENREYILPDGAHHIVYANGRDDRETADEEVINPVCQMEKEEHTQSRGKSLHFP